MKSQFKNALVQGINLLGISSEKIGSPKGLINVKEWCNCNQSVYHIVYPEKQINQNPPRVLENDIHSLFRNELSRNQQEAFCAIIPNGRVWGRNGAVISPNDQLFYDVSREFGSYGGVFGKKHSIFSQLKLKKPEFINGTVAVLAAPGANNFHHWMFDNVSRINLIHQLIPDNEIDYYVIDKMDISFQNEILSKIGIPNSKIINCHNNWNFHIKASQLILPSLPSRLGVVADWAVDYLSLLILSADSQINKKNKIYITRRNARSRKLLNESALINFLLSEGFIVYDPSEQSIEYTANLFSTAFFVIGVHGSGLANIAFCPGGVKVLDIVAPNHIDPYYWDITSFKKGEYAYLFANGKLDLEQTDLVSEKIDEDLDIDLEKFKKLYLALLKKENGN